jgi:hypothetical protein
MLVLMLRPALLSVRAQPSPLCDFEQRGERDSALQREQHRERELAVPPGLAAEEAGRLEHRVLRLRRDGLKR